MKRTAAAAASLLWAGCFYLDPINERPTIGIQQLSSGGIHRGEPVTLDSQYHDPEGQDGTFTWRVFACGDEVRAQQSGVGCDDAPVDTGTQAQFVLDAPVNLRSGGPAAAILVELAARDDRGALATGREVFSLADARPTIELRKAARSSVVGAPIDVFASYGDPDDVPETLSVAWQVFTPSTQRALELTDLELPRDPSDPDHVTAGKQFVPDVSGEWEVRVTVTDPLGESAQANLMFTVGLDLPPCLAHWQPAVPPPGQVLPILEPTVFQVPLVDDDLDVYPPVPGDPVLGAATFAWSILGPGATEREPLIGVTGNSVDFDPAAFAPGEIVELRVEVFDRQHAAIACPADAPTCSVVSRGGCTQRQTWRVEAR